jgi:hypothetical protein
MESNEVSCGEFLPVTVTVAETTAALEQLAERANEAHSEVLAIAGNAVGRGLVAGQALLEAKRICRPGTWYAWLADHFRGSRRTAQAYMRLATHIPQIEGDAHSGAHLRTAQLRHMLTGLSATDGRVRSPRAKRALANVESEHALANAEPAPALLSLEPDRQATEPRQSEAVEGRYLASVPHVSAHPDFERVANSLRQVLVDLEVLTQSKTVATQGYARHLLCRMRVVYDGLATLRRFKHWRVSPEAHAKM